MSPQHGGSGTEEPRNFMKYSSPEVDREMEASLQAVDSQERHKYCFDVQAQLVKDFPTCTSPHLHTSSLLTTTWGALLLAKKRTEKLGLGTADFA